MRSLLCLTLLVLCISSVLSSSLEWKEFKERFGKQYSGLTDENSRKERFLAAKKRVDKHNALYAKGKITYQMELNEFADWTDEEYSRMNGVRFNAKHLALERAAANMLGYSPFSGRENSSLFLLPPKVNLPESIDWRELGYVTEVKDQGHCGSCWAFATTGTLEAQHKRETGRLVSLSEQQLVDCSYAYNNKGCNGGMPDRAFSYIKENGGLVTEEEYPYEAEVNECRYKQGENQTEATVAGYTHVRYADEYQLKAAVATQGPISVAIDAGNAGFRYYKSGVYFDEECDSDWLNHGVLLVGYGSDQAEGDYWLIKNSWGEHWGDHGYIKIARNRGNNCGVATVPSYPLV